MSKTDMTFSNEILELTRQAINDYEIARKNKANLNHSDTYYYCKRALTKVAMISYILSNEEIPEEEIALEWVDGLPNPNGLYQMLINAKKDISERSTPVLNFLLSYPTSTNNLYLIKDALSELFDNIERNDEDQKSRIYLQNWRKRL